MRIAVSGASGFIGRHVLAALANHDCDPVALLRGADPGDLPGAPEVHRINITSNYKPKMADIGYPDALIHLAWGGLPNYKSAHHFKKELPAQLQFLTSLVQDGLQGLVCAGTCFEYGMQYGPLSERIQTLPSNCYAHAKDNLRKQLELLHAQRQFAFVWARLFFTYGNGQASGSLLPQLSAAVARGDERFNMSGGEQLRDYLPVNVVAKYLVSMALKKVDCGVVNICSGNPISIRRLVESWLSENDWSIDLNLGHYPYPDHEPMAFWGDVKKLKRLSATYDYDF